MILCDINRNMKTWRDGQGSAKSERNVDKIVEAVERIKMQCEEKRPASKRDCLSVVYFSICL